MAKTIAVGADHGGFLLKQKIKEYLEKKHYRVKDMGTDSDEPCDYPRFGFAAAKKVSDGKADRAIVICKSGIGMSIIGNKLPGVRAGLCGSVDDAISARRHNDTNVLVLAATKLSNKKAMEIVEAWFVTRALAGRHARRVKQIKEFEKKLFKKETKRRR